MQEDLPGVRWEIGPASGSGFFFALGLGGDLSNLRRNELILDRAPEIARFELHASKPAKSWTRRVVHLGARVIDFEPWRFRREGRAIHFEPSAASMEILSARELEGACWMFLESELGERRAIESFDRVLCRPKVRGVLARNLRAHITRTASEDETRALRTLAATPGRSVTNDT